MIARRPAERRRRGLAARAGWVGFAAGRLLLFPVRRVAGPAAQRGVDEVLAGPLPESVTRTLVEHRVVGRVVAEALANADVEGTVISALEDERTEQVVERVLASPAFERLLTDALDRTLQSGVTDRLIASPEFQRALGQTLSSPQIRAALREQSSSLLDELAAAVRRGATRLDDRLERGPRRWFRRGARTGAVPFGGLATRAVALAADVALASVIFLVGAAMVGLVASLVGHLRPEWLVGLIVGSAWAVVVIAYFVGFWSSVGQTPGMRLLGLRVVRARDGAPPGAARSLVRLASLLLAIIPLFAGFLPVLVDDRRRALPDYLAGTVVVYAGAPAALLEPAPAEVHAPVSI